MTLKLFIPCFLDQGAPQVAAATADLLDRLGLAWDYPEDQTCCGQFACTLTDSATARRLMRHFLQVFGSEDQVICPSASCTLMVRRYYPRLAQNPRESREAEALAVRTVELSEFIDQAGPLSWTPRFDAPLVLHRSCKARQLGVLSGAARVLAQVAGLQLLEVSPYYSCCGFGGIFSIQHPDLSREMGEAYLQAVLATGARGLVSLDYSCLMHLRGVASARGWDLQFFHLAEILAGEQLAVSS
ncbi:MAG: (Fe-S)-binding protein [Deltaproteobacteria bacterium]|nr:(Fe-S)-binding protein [Deltaproteobacteria bacterium]